MNDEKRLKEIDVEISELRHLRMRHLRKTNSMLNRRKERKLRKEKRIVIERLTKIGFLVDLTAISVLPISTHKSRYLRNSKGYHIKNLLVAKREKEMYAYLTNNSQITKTDVETFRTLIHKQLKEDVIVLTDNRHKVSITVSKKVTQSIEREFSRIKKPIYRKLKDIQRFRDSKIYTEIEYETLFNLYCQQLKRLNILPLNF